MDNNLQQVLKILKDSFPGALIRINGREDINEHRQTDCYDGRHLKVEIESAVFRELTILEQHQLMHGVLNRQLQINGSDIMAELHRTGELGKLLRCDPVARGANLMTSTRKLIYLSMVVLIVDGGMAQKEMQYNELTQEEERVILHKGTERPWSGEFVNHDEQGVYTCKRCNAPLYRSDDKFDSHCGWPSFDDAIEGAIKRVPDADGSRTEIICANCDGHLGHVFTGEGYTAKNTRHCVNSVSLNFEALEPVRPARAIFASGCFWGTEYHFQKKAGVLATTVGYTGGHKENPTYKQVSYTDTGHAEAVEVLYDPSKISYEELAILFFETHDPTQVDRQGPDVGQQYRSAVFYLDKQQKATAEKLIGILKAKGYDVVTEVTTAGTFWLAEDYHQDYYTNNGSTPYCHFYQKKF